MSYLFAPYVVDHIQSDDERGLATFTVKSTSEYTHHVFMHSVKLQASSRRDYPCTTRAQGSFEPM
jgi:hypothetical protein